MLEADRQRRLEDLPGWTWDTLAAKWEEGFSRLLQYVKRNHNARVPSDYRIDDYPLGSWVGTQRVKHNRGQLDADSERRLEDLPGWTWDTLAAKWEEGFTRLLGYVKHNHDACVPVAYKVDGYPLGEWISTQRDKHTEGTLDPECQARLEKLPGWTWDPKADQWEQGFSRVLQYVEHNGHARVPQSFKVGHYPLGTWVTMQRHKRTNGTLDADRQHRLQTLDGWTWDPKADKWEEGFSRLLQYVKHNGHARVPPSYKVDDYPLGAWVISQRHRGTKGTLGADRQHRLQALDGWTWDPMADKWEEGFSRLLQYVKHNGHARVPQSFKVDAYPLGAWVSQQRVDRNRGTLDDHREDRLRQVPGWTWDPFADKWRRASADC